MATDKDNIAEAIYKSVKSVSNESLLSASILGDNLTLIIEAGSNRRSYRLR